MNVIMSVRHSTDYNFLVYFLNWLYKKKLYKLIILNIYKEMYILYFYVMFQAKVIKKCYLWSRAKTHFQILVVIFPLENKWSSFRDIRLWEGENLSKWEGKESFVLFEREENASIIGRGKLSMGDFFHERADFILN